MQQTDAIVHSISKQNRNHKTYKKNRNEQTQKAKEKNKKQKNTPQESSQKQDLYILTHFNGDAHQQTLRKKERDNT
jgi:hypothetical protein